MMSFFKKETKEDKERKKLEKKLIINPSSTNNNNKDLNISTSSSLLSSSYILNSNHNLNESSHQEKITMSSNNQDNNIIITSSSQQGPPLPPKPKKGILKTMSKFGIGPTVTTNTTPIISNTIPTKSATTTKPTSIETSISNYTKRNSQVVSTDDINRNGSTQLIQQSLFCLPQCKQQPRYVNKTHLDYLNTPIGKSLIRNIQLDPSQFNSLQFSYDYDYLNRINFNLTANLDEQTNIPIIVSNLMPPFLPNDQLISINNEFIFDKSLNQIKQFVSSTNNILVLKVRTCLELGELISNNKLPVGSLELQNNNYKLSSSTSSLSSLSSNSSSSNSLSNHSPNHNQNTSNENDLNNVWLVHVNGYTPAKIFAKIIHKSNEFDSQQNVKFKIRLVENGGQLIEVGEESLEKANPAQPQFDLAQNLSQLRFINESSVLHTLRQRFLQSNLIHTHCNQQTMLILRPKNSRTNLYDSKLINLFKQFKQKEEMPPHIYSYTQSIYKKMLTQRQDQSILLMGHAGSGKTQNTQYILKYLFKISNSIGIFTEEKLASMFNLLNAFCSIKTKRNLQASNRYINVFLLEFNCSGQLNSLLLQTIQFDQTRIIYQPHENESNFLILYYILFGNCDLISTENPHDLITDNFLFRRNTNFISENECKKQYELILDSFKQLNFEQNEIKSILSILCALIYLGKAGAANSTSRLGQFKSPNEAHKAASLLGISFNQLNDYVFTFNFNINSHNGSKFGSSRASPDPNSSYLPNNLTPQECLHGFCIGLYSECMNLIVNCINRTFKSNSNNSQSASNSMLIIDPPGFQFQLDEQMPCSYSDLLCNYLSERMKLMFFQISFINPIEKCAQEGLDIDLVEHIPESPSGLVNWLDKPSSILNNNGNTSNSSTNGLLWILEEQQKENSENGKSFTQKLLDSDPKQHFLTIKNDQSFIIHHQYDQFPIEYQMNEWLNTYNKEYQTQRNVTNCLQTSKKDFVASTFQMSAAMSTLAASTTTSSSNSSDNNSSNLKRQASVRKMLTLSKRNKTFTINFKLQIDSLFDSIRRTKTNFIFSLLPTKLNENDVDGDINVPLLRSQLKAYQLVSACRIYRQGYPEYMNFEDFERRFSMFLNNNSNNSTMISLSDDLHKQNCLNLVKIFDLEQSSHFKIGSTQIFFRAGILARLEQQRDEKINDFVIKLQSLSRRYLAQKSYAQKRLEDSAIRCIQKNIRISFALKQWKWWKLYTNLMPIVSVQNNETLMKQMREELDEVKKKNEKLINEKNELKLLNNQLENKLMNLQTEYVEEHAANAGTLDILEVETSERIRLEKELNELRPLYNSTIKKLETLETEMLELRLYNTKKSIEEELEKEENSPSSNEISSNEDNLIIFKQQNDKLKKDLEMLKKQLKQEKENAQMLSTNDRAFFEAKLKEKDNELLELEKQTALHKRKYQKLCEEMQDLQRLCEESKIKNRDLEKQYSKFDSELSLWKSKFENEKEIREKCERERDTTKYELYALKSELDAQKMETQYQMEKCERLERDLKDYETNSSTNSNVLNNGIGSSSSDQFMKLKAQIRDMEVKLRDQEEELDEQTSSIQLLEQSKLRLEMQLEKEKQKWQRELAEKESEMDDLRFHTQKKIKAIEMQLEEESELNGNLQREKRDLDRKLREIQSTNSNSKNKRFMNNNDFYINGALTDYISKLKRQMLKYKTLAIDAQTQLEKLKQNIPKQSIMKALKSQLEDSEIMKANALKTKQLLQTEINDLQEQLEDSNMHKQSVEEQNMMLNREINNLKSLLEEQERDADEILKKYQNHIQNYSFDSHKFIDLNNQIDVLTIENRILKEKLRELEEKIQYYESSWIDKVALNKLEGKVRDLECKLDLETTHKQRLQNQLERVKQQYEKSLTDIDVIVQREKKCEDTLKKAHKQNREYLEELGDLRKKLIDLEETRKRYEQQNDILEKELESSRSEIKVNQNRLEAFQNAFNLMNNDDDDDEDEDEDDDDDEDEDDEYMTNGDGDEMNGDEFDEDDNSSSVDRLSQYTNRTSNTNNNNNSVLRQSIEENGYAVH